MRVMNWFGKTINDRAHPSQFKIVRGFKTSQVGHQIKDDMNYAMPFKLDFFLSINIWGSHEWH